MKRRSQAKPKRDLETEALKKMTHISLSENQMRERLLADKAALEVRLRDVFAFRNSMNFPKGGLGEQECKDLIRGISAELRMVKEQLREPVR